MLKILLAFLVAACLSSLCVAADRRVSEWPPKPHCHPQTCMWRYGPVDQLVEVTLIDDYGCLRRVRYWRRVTKWYQHCEPTPTPPQRYHILEQDE